MMQHRPNVYRDLPLYKLVCLHGILSIYAVLVLGSPLAVAGLVCRCLR